MSASFAFVYEWPTVDKEFDDDGAEYSFVQSIAERGALLDMHPDAFSLWMHTIGRDSTKALRAFEAERALRQQRTLIPAP